MNNKLVSDRAYFGVIGGLINQPQLIDCIDLPLDREDFNTDEFYEILFIAIHNLYKRAKFKRQLWVLVSRIKEI